MCRCRSYLAIRSSRPSPDNSRAPCLRATLVSSNRATARDSDSSRRTLRPSSSAQSFKSARTEAIRRSAGSLVKLAYEAKPRQTNSAVHSTFRGSAPLARGSVARGSPVARAPHPEPLDPSRRALRPVPPVLRHRGGRRTPHPAHRHAPAAGGRQTPGGRRVARGAGSGRHPDTAVRTRGPGGRSPSQPDTRAYRRPVRLRARVGGSGPVGGPPAVGH